MRQPSLLIRLPRVVTVVALLLALPAGISPRRGAAQGSGVAEPPAAGRLTVSCALAHTHAALNTRPPSQAAPDRTAGFMPWSTA